MYCLVTVTSLVLLVSGAPTTQGQQATSGVYLSLKGAYLANNSYVDVDDIGEDESALMCLTNKTNCCRNSPDRAGEWYFPNGSIVQQFVQNYYHSGLSEFFYRNRGESVVRLNRYGNNPLERGHFFCELPDANDVNKTLHVNILNISSLTISPSRHIEHGTGEMLFIYCRVDIVLPLNVPPPTFEWFFGPNNSSLPSGVTVSPVTKHGNTYNSTLQFSPLLVNHAGIYKCQLGGNRKLAANTTLTVTAACNAVSGNKVHITGDVNSVYVGDRYTLTCSFINSSRSHGNFTYQWRKDGSPILNVTESTLTFSSLTLSDAGQYTCEVTADFVIYYCGTKDITLEIPAPSFVTITSDPVSPIRPVGSDVAVTCSVELSPTVDVPVNVSIHLTDPSGSQLSTTSSLSDSTYTSITMIRSFSRNHSGVYTCEATLNSDSKYLTESGTLSKDVDITTHVYISLGNDIALENNTYLFVTDVGTTAPHQLVCTSDRMPCCRDSPQYGEWKFPNGSKVTHTNEGAVSFHSDRDNVGNVNLYRVNENVTSPGGQFCCEVEDATNTNTTLCVIVVPDPNVTIISNKSNPIRPVGSAVKLTCTVELSQAVDVPVTLNTVWTGPDGFMATNRSLLTIETRDAYTTVVTIASVGRSQSGDYYCSVSIGSASSNMITHSSTTTAFTKVTVGVYLSMGGEILPSNRVICVTDIETSAISHQYLVCTSDRKPCCRDPPQYGEWKFPNGSQVQQISKRPRAFYRNRDYAGNVNLYRVSSNVTSPTGRFCCEVPDATDTNHTLCIDIVPPITIQVRDNGTTPIAGQSYTLTCDLGSTVTTYPHTLSYQWLKDNGTQTQVGTGHSSISFHTLTLSDSGNYTCVVTVSSTSLKEDKEFRSTPYFFDVPIPDPNVTVTSNKSNPIRPVGSAVELTCTVELSPAVDVPVTVNTVWTGPDGFMATNRSLLTMETRDVFTLLVTIASVGRSQSGDYYCSVSIGSASSMIANSRTTTGFTKVTVGVYLSMGGEILPSNRVICVTDIGTSELSHQYLVCTSDRKPCCRDPPQYGEWKFPNGSLVQSISRLRGAVAFYTRRDNAGNVNFYRVSSNVTSPTGRFCCEIPDATDTNYTLCVDIIPPITVQVKDGGTTPIAGQSYTLTCDLGSTVTTYPHTLSYQWIKDNGTQTEVGRGHSSISFPALTLSDSGNYTCVVTVSSTSLKEDKEFRSTPYVFDVPIPQPVVGLVSITPNPILSGSSPTLTCTVELDPTVDVPVDVTTVWSGPDGSTLMSDASPVMKSFTHYTSKLTLNYVELSDSGNYTCTVSIRGKVRASVSKEVVINDGVFQLRLIDSDICQPWFKKENYQSDKRMELYKSAIEEALIEAIESHCECRFPKDHLLKAIFKCASSPNLTTYRNTLIGTHNFNATQLIGFLQDWVNSAPYIDVNDYAVSVDKSCPVSIASLSDPECGEVSQCPCANDPNVAKCVEHLENEDFTACINSCI